LQGKQMSTFALIMNGAVVQLAAAMFPVNPALVWTNDISAVSPAPQVGWTAMKTAGAWNFTAPVIPAPTLAQQAAAAMLQGLAITSTGTPALNGTYGVDPMSQGRVASISTYILVNGNFPGAMATYPFIDMSGAPHVFPTTASFQAFATACANYVAAVDFVAATGTGTLPVATATIP
jgi:hypothetical protein